MGAEAITLGCRLNFAESEAMKRAAPDGTIIVNSCAVTNEAVRQTRQSIRRARRKNPDARIVATGCAVQLDPKTFAAMPEVDEILTRDFRQIEAPAAGFMSRVKSFVSIQNGCDHRCTFCSIWQARGPSRSMPFEQVHDAIAREIDRGAKEIILTGVDITDYRDQRGGLGTLCQRLLASLPQLRRLRLSSLDSVEIDEALLELVAGEDRLMPHFHLSLQAGDDLILKRMKRRHSRAQSVAMVEALKKGRPDVTIGADLIAGFPTEGEQAAANTRALIADCDIVAAHIFPFSPRPDTPAARIPQLPRELVKERAALLRETASAHRSAWLDRLVGTSQRMLVENKGKGHADNVAPVLIDGGRKGDIIEATITARQDDYLIGSIT